MVKKVVLFGAGDFARELIWVIEEVNARTAVNKSGPVFEVAGIVDEDLAKEGSSIMGFPVYGLLKPAAFWETKGEKIYASCAVGRAVSRKKLMAKAKDLGYNYLNLIHPEAVISDHAELKSGIIVMPGSIITVGVKIGEQVLINKLCSVGHDSVIGKDCTLAPGVIVGGHAVIEEGCDIGMNASILPSVRIKRNSTIGAGAVVNKDLPADCTAVGVPAKIISR